MRVIHVLRKPLSEGTVASNVLKHGCGGLNIDASRVGTDDNLNGGAYAENASARHDGAENWRYKRGGAGRSSLPGDTREGATAGMFQPSSTVSSNFVQPSGRWPANDILQHLDGCRCGGTKRVKANQSRSVGAGKGHGIYQERMGGVVKASTADADGKETVVNWICVEGCPVAALDERTLSNGMHGTGAARRKTVQGSVESTTYNMGGEREMPRYGDKGGASRFYKQVGGKTDEAD